VNPARARAAAGHDRRPQDALLLAAAAGALLVLAAYVLILAGGPIATDDAWWHLAMGRVYAHVGPWPDGDPLLHTAHADAPVQHEWLFGVLLFGIESAGGFAALRAAHALAVMGIVALAFALCRRQAGSAVAACAGASLFLVLAWWRLFQLRPDLVSIPAALAVWPLLLERGGPPSARRVAAFVALCALWANVHSLFAIGLGLVAAALAALPLRAWLAGRLPEPERPARGKHARVARRLALALGLGTLASAVNPRGFEQHLTFLTSSRETGIWRVHDEWTPFHPFAFDYTTEAMSRLAWLVTDALLAAFLLCAAISAARFLRRPDARRLAACDPVLFALGCAGIVALLVSIRFLWLGIFPLLFVLRSLRPALAGPPSRARAARLACAALAVALAAAFPRWTSWAGVRALQAPDARAWLAEPFVTEKYHPTGVRFLRETGLEGNLFNKYPMGGFLGYWLAPRLRTFVDSRTEHYPSEVLEEYSAVNLLRGRRAGESFVDVLDRRSVDVFFGTGPPIGLWRDSVLYTAEHLRGRAGWLLVSRAVDHAIWLRTGFGEGANLERVTAWYAREGVPFDRERGLDPSRVIDERPDWAIAQRMLPLAWDELRARAAEDDADALDALGRTFALLGLYERALAVDAQATAVRPDAKGPRRRQVYALLRLGRDDEARRAAEELLALDPGDPRSQAVQRIAARAPARGGTTPSSRPVSAPDAAVARFPLLDDAERDALAREFAQARLP
jgi:hypothetical protein